ncbi:MAG: TIGR03936 family radical SAM-associated protein [Candidatus Aureabacteria bacterium]|nr:TIGR03936 family radical SAM-associated protein [Candidatus Auribacterota bacterium]
MTYSKEGLIKFISHLDIIRLWQRAFRRAGVQVAVSKGFSPHPVMSFGPPLPVGVAGREELLDVALVQGQGEALTAERLQGSLPGGIGVRGLKAVPDTAASLCATIDRAAYEVEFEPEYGAEVRARVEAARAAVNLISRTTRQGGERVKDIRPLVHALSVEDQADGTVILRCTVSVGVGGTCNPYELLEAVLGWPGERVKQQPVTRTALFSSRTDSRTRPPRADGDTRRTQ